MRDKRNPLWGALGIAGLLVVTSACDNKPSNPASTPGSKNSGGGLSMGSSGSNTQSLSENDKQVITTCSDLSQEDCEKTLFGLQRCKKDGDKCVDIPKFQSCEDFSDGADCIRSCQKNGNDCEDRTASGDCDTSDLNECAKKSSCAVDHRTGKCFNLDKQVCRMKTSTSLKSYCVTKNADVATCQDTSKVGGQQICLFTHTDRTCTLRDGICHTISVNDQNYKQCEKIGVVYNAVGGSKTAMCKLPATGAYAALHAQATGKCVKADNTLAGLGPCQHAIANSAVVGLNTKSYNDYKTICETIKATSATGNDYDGASVGILDTTSVCEAIPANNVCSPNTIGDPCREVAKADCGGSNDKTHGLCDLQDNKITPVSPAP